MPWYEWWCVWFFSDTNRGRQTKTEKAEKPNKSVQVRASFGRISFVPDCIQQSVSVSRLLKSEHWSCLGLSIYAFRHVLHLICSRIFIQRHMFLLWKCLGTKRQFHLYVESESVNCMQEFRYRKQTFNLRKKMRGIICVFYQKIYCNESLLCSNHFQLFKWFIQLNIKTIYKRSRMCSPNDF